MCLNLNILIFIVYVMVRCEYISSFFIGEVFFNEFYSVFNIMIYKVDIV